MAERALFLGGQAINQATLTASSQVATLPVSNLQDYKPEKRWRATGNASERLTVRLAAARACNACAVTGHNGTAAATIRIQGGTTMASVTGGSSPSVDTGFVSMWPSSGRPVEALWPQYSSLIRWSNATAYEWWSITLADPTNPRHLEAARIMIDQAFRPRFTVGHSYGIGLVLGDAQRRTAFNRIHTERRGPPARQIVLPLNMVNKRDLWDSLYTLYRLYGIYDDFFVSIDPSETTDLHKISMQAMFSDKAQFESQPIFDADGNVWRCSVTMVELV